VVYYNLDILKLRIVDNIMY